MNTTKINAPLIEQTNGYNCGPTVLKTLLAYYKMSGPSIKELEGMGDTTKKYGTFPEVMVEVAGKLGLAVEAKKNATIDELIEKMDNGIPVVVLFTVHDTKPCPASIDLPEKLWYGWQGTLRHAASEHDSLKKLLRAYEEPHYLILTGHDEKDLTFIDVSYGVEKSMPRAEFEAMWYGNMDKKRSDATYDHWMMAVSKKH